MAFEGMEHAEMSICVDCLMWFANNETSPEWSAEERADFLRRVGEKCGGDEVTLGSMECKHCGLAARETAREQGDDVEDCEPWFSWSGCDTWERLSAEIVSAPSSGMGRVSSDGPKCSSRTVPRALERLPGREGVQPRVMGCGRGRRGHHGEPGRVVEQGRLSAGRVVQELTFCVGPECDRPARSRPDGERVRVMSEVKLVNVSNPAAYGVEWVAAVSGNRYQLVNIRSTDSLRFGMFVNDRWYTTRVVAPERFGLDRPPEKFAEFLKVAEAYING